MISLCGWSDSWGKYVRYTLNFAFAQVKYRCFWTVLKLTPEIALQKYLETSTVWLLRTNNPKQSRNYASAEAIGEASTVQRCKNDAV